MTNKNFILFAKTIIKIDEISRLKKGKIQQFYTIECTINDKYLTPTEYFDIIEERDKRFNELVDLLCLNKE